MNRWLAVFALFACLTGGVFAASVPESAAAFWIELEGKVAIEGSGDAGAVKIVPKDGLAVRVENASRSEWASREGWWVETKGVVFLQAGEPRIRLWEFSVEDDAPEWRDPAVEIEGSLIATPDGRALRTHIGDAPLVGLGDGLPSGASVDIEGYLIIADNALAIHVTRAELD